MGKPEEVAAMAVFLCSNEASLSPVAPTLWMAAPSTFVNDIS